MLTLFKCFVRPLLEYCNIIWNPVLKRQSQSIERVQRRATKLIPQVRHLNYIERLRKLNLPSLKFRRLRGDLIQTYKIFNKIDDLNPASIFNLPNNTNTRNSLFKIFTAHSQTNLRKNIFRNRISKHWNPLTNCTKSAKSVNAFKNRLVKETTIEHQKFKID